MQTDPAPYDAGEAKTPIDLHQYATPFDAIKTADQFTQFALDTSKGLTRRRYAWHSNNSLFDATNLTADDANGTISLDTAESADDTLRIRTALAGQYISQTLAQPGAGLDISRENVNVGPDGKTTLSHGSLAIGAGWHDGSSGGWGVGGPVQTFLGIRFTSTQAEAVLISNGTHLGDSPVPQSEWNVDTMDGSGGDSNPSGLTLDPARGYIYNFPYGWYGFLPLYVGIIDAESHSAVMFHKFDVAQSSLDRPNLCPMVIADNGSSARSLSADLGGMQYTLYGTSISEEGGEERGMESTRTGLTITTNVTTNNNAIDPVAEPGDPIIAIRREKGIRDLAMRMDEAVITPDNDIWVFAWDEYEPETALTGHNFREPHEVINGTETLLEVDTESTAYSPTTAVGRGMDFAQTDKNQESLKQISTDDRIPVDATRIYTAVETGTDAGLSPAFFRAVEGY